MVRFNDVIKSPVDKRDYVITAQGDSLPKNYDLRRLCKGVLNQGTEGSCSAHAVAIVKEIQENMNEGLNARFSPDYIYCQRENRVSEGMTPRDTMKLLSKGALPQSYWRHRYCKRIPAPIHELAKEFAISAYATVSSATALKEAIWRHGGAYIAVPVYNNTTKMWKPVYNQPLIGGHAMAVVGWDENKGFIIQNSWGVEWGDHGCTYLPFKEFNLIWEAWLIIDGETADIFRKNGKLTKDYKKIFKEKLKKYRKMFGKNK